MKFIEIENRAGKVKIDGSIHEGTMDALIDRMATLYGDDAVRNELRIGDAVAVASDSLESLEIEINSPGGSIKQGYRAYKTIMELRERGVYVTARITKLAASMGSILATAADKVIIEEKAQIMIHEASTVAWGNAKEMKDAAEMLDSISNELAAIYAGRMGKSVSEVRELMMKETWMDAKQAVALKLADEIYTKDKSTEKPKSKLERILDGEELKAEFDTDAKDMASIFSFLKGDAASAEILAAAAAENETLATQLADTQAKLTEAQGFAQVVAEKDVEITNLTTANAALTNEVASIKAELETAKADVVAKATEIEAVKASVETKAAELLAARGHIAPVNLEDDGKAKQDDGKPLTGLARVSAAFSKK